MPLISATESSIRRAVSNATWATPQSKHKPETPTGAIDWYFGLNSLNSMAYLSVSLSSGIAHAFRLPFGVCLSSFGGGALAIFFAAPLRAVGLELSQ
ncbi:hypothetical protein [Allomesorhizobium alhagi]|uniref:hypothetical protein n=1 Tax=Allomesorhizobium alhagi TaxID=475067 RepID=UPI001111BA27|nr:hypothetical protein [Mesorhizobium alhagi]